MLWTRFTQVENLYKKITQEVTPFEKYALAREQRQYEYRSCSLAILAIPGVFRRVSPIYPCQPIREGMP